LGAAGRSMRRGGTPRVVGAVGRSSARRRARRSGARCPPRRRAGGGGGAARRADHRPPPQRARTARRPHRPRGDAGYPRRGRRPRSLAARGLHAGGHARALPDVRGSGVGGTARQGRVRGRRLQSGRDGVAVQRGCRQPAQPSE
jgi:hypothetical protein